MPREIIGQDVFRARTILIGERIDLRALRDVDVPATT